MRLDDALLDQARREARRRGTTLTALIEQGLRLAIRPPSSSARTARIRLPVSRARSGSLPGVDLDDSDALVDRMDGIG